MGLAQGLLEDLPTLNLGLVLSPRFICESLEDGHICLPHLPGVSSKDSAHRRYFISAQQGTNNQPKNLEGFCAAC